MQYKTERAQPAQNRRRLGVAHLVEGSVQSVQTSAGERATDRCPQRSASLGPNLRSRPGGCLRHSKRDRESNRRPVAGKALACEKNAIEQRPTTDVAAFELYSRAKDLILNTGFSALASQNLRSGSICSIKPSPAIPCFLRRNASSRMPTTPCTGC